MPPLLSRRRFIGITAAAAGLGLVPSDMGRKPRPHLVTWRGQAMGAVATLQIHHHDRAAAERLIKRSLAEVRRLEAVFSLYRDDSALAALNRQGILVAPPADLVAVLAECRRYWELTGGAFDPTVQALWTLYRDHFSKPDAASEGPPAPALREAMERVGFGQVAFDANRIALPRRGMGLTLNGIAQGYATDRVVDILRAGGLKAASSTWASPGPSEPDLRASPGAWASPTPTTRSWSAARWRSSTGRWPPPEPMASASIRQVVSTT